MARRRSAEDLCCQGFLAGITGTGDVFQFGPKLDVLALEPVPLESCCLSVPVDSAPVAPVAKKKPRLRKHTEMSELAAELHARAEVANA
eukprot:6346834-Amphidinium_carterae.1